MTCQQSTTQRPCHHKLTTRAGEHKNIIKAFNMFLSTIRSEKETLEWYIARFERNYAEVEKLGETLSPSLLAALLLRHAQLPKDDIQVISMNLEPDPKATNAARNFESCKESMRRLQHNKIISHLTSDNQSERNIGDDDDLDREPENLKRISSGKAVTQGEA